MHHECYLFRTVILKLLHAVNWHRGLVKTQIAGLVPEFPPHAFEVGPRIYISKNSLSDIGVRADTSEGLSALE